MNNTVELKILNLITPVAEDMGYEIIAISLKGAGGGKTLEVLAENLQTKTMGIEDCAKLSREIGTLLDVEELISGAYRLEVSSPGIARPLIKMSDFTDYIGFEAKIEMKTPLDNGQKRFRGVLKGEKDGNILIETDQGEVALDYKSVHKAKLVLTNELINATKKVVC